MATRKLYWGSGSGPAWRARIALEEKELQYDSTELNFAKKEQKQPEVLAINPRGQVPTFKDGEVIINESLALILYLEETYPEHALLPKSQPARAKALQRFFEADTLATKFRAANFSKTEPEKFKPAIEALKAELELWEGYVREGFVAGKDFTAADIAVIPFVLKIDFAGASLEGYPNLQAYVKAVRGRKTVESTRPPHWAKAPEDWLKGQL